MCGIFACVNHPLDEDGILKAVESLYHRGPDGTGVYSDPEARVGLGHTRLSIIDIEGGAQPLFSEDANIVVVCNGEIYDFERIRSELEAKGHTFATLSDSEVILHLYEEYGFEFTKHLRGEFAFVLYDKLAGKVIALRDRFGIKPLYVHQSGEKFIFASEAKAIFATGLVKPTINVEAIRNYLSIVVPESIFEGITTVPAGSAIEIDLETGTSITRKYWDLDLPPEPDPLDDERDFGAVRQQFDEAVKLRLRADVPVGVYLSGGIDSAIVAGTVATFHNGPVKAFNISFPEDGFNEFDLSKQMADHIGAEFHSVTCTHDVLLENTEDALWITEFPFVNFHGVGKHCLSRLANQHVKVVLTGEGSDEVFLGYVHFQPGSGSILDQWTNNKKERKAPDARKSKRLVDALGFVPTEDHVLSTSRWVQTLYQLLFGFKHTARLRARRAMDALKAQVERTKTDVLPLVRRIQHFGIRNYLTPYILGTLGDRAEMSHSIEGRTPFLDHHLFERARRMPDEVKIRDGVEKFVLREAFQDRIIPEIRNRKKWPYSAPPIWVRRGEHAELDRLLKKYCSREAFKRSGIFNYSFYLTLQLACRALFFSDRFQRHINSVLTLVLTVQILDHLYVQDLEGSLAKRAHENGPQIRQ